jgi:hypothetical protein
MGGEWPDMPQHGPGDHANGERGAQQKTSAEFHSVILESSNDADVSAGNG